MNIYINNIAKWRVDKYTFNDNQLDVRSISMTVTHPSNWIGENAPAVADFTDAYVLYKGERFELTVSSPTAEKNTSSIDYKYELIFKGVEEELSRRKVRDLAKVGESNFVAQGTSFILSGDAQQFTQLIENNLKYYFNGDWTISLLENPGDDLYSFAKIAVDNMSIWELLGKTYEYYGLRWKIKNKEIIIGYTPDVVEHIFDYGKDGGLVKITRTKQDENTINRLIAVGSSRNIPLNYFTDRYDKFPKDPNPISSVVNIRNLMPKVFRDSVKAGAPPYIDYVEDSILVAKDGVRESIESPNEDIYPSISKVEVAGIGRIDQIVASEIPTTDSSSDNGYSQTFDIWIKDIGFDLIDDKYTSTQDAKISFTSGELAGYEFTILATGGVRHVSEDTSKSHNGVQSKYRITLIKSDEDYDATGRMLPNTVLYPKVYADGSADSFVIYDIEMPQVYVELAEERLEAWMNERLDKLKIEKPTYAIEIMDSFFATATIESDNKKIEDKIIAGNKVKINNTNVTNGVQELFISNVKVDYKGILPKYFITITDKLGEDRGVISRIENTINKVSNNQQVDKQEIKSNLHTHANKMVLDLFKEDSQGNVYLDRNFYSTGNISAFGFEDDGGGGVTINVIDSLTSTSKTDALSANQGRYLKTLIDNIEVGEGGQVIVDWEAITGKPSTFAPSAHTHIIGDVTGLQGELDGKASLSQLDDKEDKFTKNSAFNKSFGTGLNDVARGNHTHTFASLTSKPTTLAGYGITDGANKVHTHAISDVTNLQTELDKKATNTALTTHVNETDNPHSVTKKQVGLEFVANKDLSNVDNIQQATKTEFTSHKNLFNSMFRKVGANIEAKLSLYSLGGLSAYGFSEEGSEGGGGIVNILPSWANYTTDKSGWALSAGLGVDLNTRKADKTWVESLLEDYVPTDTTYTAGRGLTLTGTVFSTSFDIANYATVTALDGKVDKKTGFSLISDTEIARLANVTNQDISGKADKSTSLAGYGITDAYTKTSVDTLLSGKENAFTKNSAFNKNFGTTVGTVAQGNDSRILNGQTAFGWGDFRAYGLGRTVRNTLLDGNAPPIMNEFIDTNVLTENTPFSYSPAMSISRGGGRGSYIIFGYNEETYLKSFNTTSNKGWQRLWTDKNLRSNSENDTRYKEPFDSFKTTFDTMFRKTSTNEIEAKLSLYTLGGLSAYGFSDEGSSGGGGGIVNILSDWANYDASKSGWALGAGLGKGLYDDKADKTDPRFTDARTPLAHSHPFSDVTGLQNALDLKTNQTFSDGLNTRLTSVEGGSATTVNVSGTGDLLASVSKVGNNINFIKGNQSWNNLTGKPSTFAPSAHSHSISDVTGLQSTLNNKLATNIFNAHNTDNVRHITGVERAKWDTVVTDFAELEIGGRNLVKTVRSVSFLPTYNVTATKSIIDDATVPSGFFLRLDNYTKTGSSDGFFFPGDSSHYTERLRGKRVTISFYMRGDIPFLLLGNIEIGTEWTKVVNTRVWSNTGNLHIFRTNADQIGLKTMDLSSIKIEKGTIATDWTPAPEDQVSDWLTTDVNSFSFIKNKPTMLSQFIDNIGVAQHRIDFDAFKTTFDTMFRKTPTNEIEAKLSLYTLGGLSAYGFSDEGSSGGGGGIVNILSDWANYDASKSGWALGAGLGKGLYDDKADKTDPRFTDARTPLAHSHPFSDVTGLQNALDLKTNQTFSDGLNTRLTSVEGGSATTVNVSGTGDLLASVSKVGNNINFIKGNQSWNNLSGKPSTFAPSAHSHPISDITNLQTTLNSKLETSIFNTHNNDNVRHITGAERTKWDKVVTDFAGLEIGGRNLAQLTNSKEWRMYTGGTISFGEYKGITTVKSTDNGSGYIGIGQGSKAQKMLLVEGEQYVISMLVRGTVPLGYNYIMNTGVANTSFGSFTYEQPLNEETFVKAYAKITGTATHELSTGSYFMTRPTVVNEGDWIEITQLKIEKGTIPTDWTPAPEDQISDWLTTDINSFSFIKNKPTLLSQFTDNIGVATHIANKTNPHSVTKAQVGLSNVDNAKQATKVEFDLFKSAYDEMFRKVGTSIEAKLPLYSLGGLSAYGFSDEGSSSGSGIVNILPSWESYDTSKSGWALSAGLGENLRTRVVALENAEIDLSGYATLTYVNDKVKTNVPLNAKFTDTIVDISGKVDKKSGFSLVADTEITRLSSVTNQDLTPYALKTYVDTEVGKKWTYNETTIKAVKVSNAVRADNVGGFTVGVNVPANAKFTDTIVDISGKVDKVSGKGLSTNDFTTVEKNKLAILENQTRESLGVDNVTNESKATMFTNPTFTGTTKVTILELDSNWKFVKVGDNIELQFDGVTKQIMTNNGDIIATAGVTAYQ